MAWVSVRLKIESSKVCEESITLAIIKERESKNVLHIDNAQLVCFLSLYTPIALAPCHFKSTIVALALELRDQAIPPDLLRLLHGFWAYNEIDSPRDGFSTQHTR